MGYIRVYRVQGLGLRVKGPGTQLLGTWEFGNSNFSAGFGEVYDYWVLGPLGEYNRALNTAPRYMFQVGTCVQLKH